MTSDAHPFCHREERSDVAISFLGETLLRQRDCFPRIECGVAMTMNHQGKEFAKI